MRKIARHHGDISSDFQPGLSKYNNYVPYLKARHPHETIWTPNYGTRQRTNMDIINEEEAPISSAKAKLHFVDSTIWNGPSLVGLILMAKPQGPDRPHSFPELHTEGIYKPRRYALDAAFRTLWRCNKATNPENMIQNEGDPKRPPLVDRGTASLSVFPMPYEMNIKDAGPKLTSPTSPGILPRGLVIPCRRQVDLTYEAKSKNYGFHGGFPYPQKLMLRFKVTKKQWNAFCEEIHDVVRPYAANAPWFGAVKIHGNKFANIPSLVDSVLDTVSRWETDFFRPKGLLVRMDTPGEARFGLTTMDIWHQPGGAVGHVDNCQGVLSQHVLDFEKIDTGNTNKKTRRRSRHLHKLLESTYSSTRLVFDEIAVLEDTKLAYERGWMVWNASSHWARVLKPDESCASRIDRWPRSKHLYYDRFVGNYKCTAKVVTGTFPHRVPVETQRYNHTTHNYQSSYVDATTHLDTKRIDPHGSCVWEPEAQSMDQRRSMFATRMILPADCAPARIEAHINEKTLMLDTDVYWQAWALEVLEQDGYYRRGGRPQIGAVYRRAPKTQIRITTKQDALDAI